jgi:hypothetical protein
MALIPPRTIHPAAFSSVTSSSAAVSAPFLQTQYSLNYDKLSHLYKQREALFCSVALCNLVCGYRRFGIYQSDLQGSRTPVVLGLLYSCIRERCCLETSVTKYQLMLRNIPEEQRHPPYRGRSLRSRMGKISLYMLVFKFLGATLLSLS